MQKYIPTIFKNVIKRILYKKIFYSKGLMAKYPELVNKNIRIECPVTFFEKVYVANDVQIGKYTYIVEGTVNSGVKIGRYCSLGRQLSIGEIDHPIEWLTTSVIVNANGNGKFKYDDFPKYDYQDNRKTIIGNDVWAGLGVILKRGITIGDGAIIGAGSVVTHDVAPYAIVGGVPAKLIRYRFNNEIINKLLELQWLN